MDFLPWKDSQAYSLGAELEVRLHEEGSMVLANGASKIHEALPKSIQPNVHYEYLASMLELVSPVCKTPKETSNSLQHLSQELAKTCSNFGLVSATSGTSALPCENIKLSDNPRYRAIAKEYGILLRKFNICGLHVHVGMESSDAAIRAYNMTLEHLPLFIALGANSVFFDGEDSGLQAYRNKIFEQLPRAGLPYYFEEFFEMGELYEALHNSQTIESSRDIWWDVRINPIFKTVELRVCDASNDFIRIELLIALFQALCRYAQSVPAQWMYRQILRQNKWNAVRYGLDGIYQNKKSVYTLREHGKHLFEEMENVGVFDSLNTNEYLPKLYQLLNHPNPAYFQKECFEKHRCLSEVERLGIFKEKE